MYILTVSLSCDSLFFDKTRNLGGYNMRAVTVIDSKVGRFDKKKCWF